MNSHAKQRRTLLVLDHVAAPANAVAKGVASKLGGIIQRLLSPFTEGVIVPVCRATHRARTAAAKLTDQLSAASLTGCATAAFMVVAGADVMRMVFGPGYCRGEWVVLALVLAAIVRATYPFSSGRMEAPLSLRSSLRSP